MTCWRSKDLHDIQPPERAQVLGLSDSVGLWELITQMYGYMYVHMYVGLRLSGLSTRG